MEQDAVPDFSSRRAMFQQMSQAVSVPQPSHQAAIFKGHKYATLGDTDQKRQSYARAMSSESYTLGKPVQLPKPFALPRVKFDGVVQVNKTEEPKINTSPLSLGDSGPEVGDTEKHKLMENMGREHDSNSKNPEALMDKQHFRNTLLLWEKTASHSPVSRQLSQTSSITLDGSVSATSPNKSDKVLESSPPRWKMVNQEAGPYGCQATDQGYQPSEFTEPYQYGDTYEDVLAVRAGFDSIDASPATGNENNEYVSLMSDKEIDSLNSKNNQNGVTDVYYDVECVNGGLNRFESSTFTSDSFSETSNEVYEDIHNVIKDDNCSNTSEKADKLKGLGRIFKKNKGKFIPKMPKSNENGIIKVASVPNLKAEDPDLNSASFYNDVENGTAPNAVKKVDDKQKTRLPKFLLNKEGKEKKKSLDWVESEEGMYADVQTQGSRSFLKSKGKKVSKEEKLFREKYGYTKDIEVINTAVVDSSAKTGKWGKLDLPIKPGEELDIIDITDENLVICRNSGGKYGYVLVEYLNFKS